MQGGRGCGSLMARFVAGLAAATLVVMLPVALLTHNMASVLFDPLTLSRTMSDILLRSKDLREALVDGLSGEPTDSGDLNLRSATMYLTPEQRQVLANRLLPEGWVQDELQHVTTELFAWFDSSSTRLLLTVDASPFAAALETDAPALVEMMVDSWPACTLDDIGEMVGLGAIPGQQGFPFCEPPEPLRTVVVSSLSGALRLVGTNLPDRIAIVDETFADSDRLLETKERVRMIRFFGRWGILASLGLLGVITMAAVRSWKGLARWWGVPLLLGGLLAFVPVLAREGMIRWLVARLTPGFDALPPLAELVRALVGSLAESVLETQAGQAVVLVVIGVALLLLSFLGRRKGRSRAQPARRESPQESASEPPDAVEELKDRPTGMFG